MNNPAFVVSDEGVVVIDPGSSLQVGEMLLARIEKVTDKPILAVFNSHIHGDHWLGNQAIRDRYPEVPIYGHDRVGPKILAGAGIVEPIGCSSSAARKMIRGPLVA